jgi:plasmid stabilization system protein ParE
MEIVWTKKGRNSFEKNVDYLLIYWNDKIAIRFINETNRTLHIISKNPYIGRYKDFGCNIFLVVEQIYLFYEVINDTIVIQNFWDNRQKPIRKLNI